MAFFGITTQGDYNQLLHSQPAGALVRSAFDGIDDASFDQAFDRRTMGECAQARALQVQRCGASQIDGGLHMLRKKLVHILPEVLGREATKQEFDTFFTWLDFDSNCVVSRAEYQAAYRALKASCAKLGEQREWSSFTGKRLDVLRHKRLPYEPQDTLVGGVTEAQQIGWHAIKPHPGKDCYRPAGSTDVTQREGRSLADYYGVYTLIGLQQ